MANKYLDCTIPAGVASGDGTEENPYNLRWVWENTDTGNTWYIKGRVYAETPNQIQIKPTQMIMWDYYSPFLIDGIQTTDDFVSEVQLIRGALGDFDVVGRAESVSASILFGSGTAGFNGSSVNKNFNCCTFYTDNPGPTLITIDDHATSGDATFKSCIFNGARLACNNGSMNLTMSNIATDRPDIMDFLSSWTGAESHVDEEVGVTLLPFVTSAAVIASPETEKEKLRYSKLINDGYTSSGLDSADPKYDFEGSEDDGVYGFFGGRRYGRGAIWFDNAYYVDLSQPASVGTASGDENNKWGYLDFLNFLGGQIVSRQRVREADVFYLEGDYTWVAPITFPSFRNLSMKFFENSPESIDYISISFKRRNDGVPIRINSPTELVDFGTNNKFEFIILKQGTLGANVRYNEFTDCIFFHPTEIKLPASFVGSTKGVVTFNRCDFITQTIYLKGEPTNDPADFSAHFYRCALYGYDTNKIKIKADNYSQTTPVNISRVMHFAGSSKILRQAPMYITGNVFTECHTMWTECCSGTVFNGGYWAHYETDPTTDKEMFYGSYYFPEGFKTEVDTEWYKSGPCTNPPYADEVHIRDTFGVTDTGQLLFEASHAQLDVFVDTLHDPDTLNASGINQQDSSTFYYNDTPFTGLANVTGLTQYNGGGAFDFSNIPKQFSQRPPKVTFDWNHPDVLANYVNWSVVKAALGIPSWDIEVTVYQLEQAYAYCVSNGHMLGNFALINVNTDMAPKPFYDPYEAFQNNILFLVTARILIRLSNPTGFWNCASTASINVVVKAGASAVVGGHIYSDGMYRGMILAEPGSAIEVGYDCTSYMKTMRGAVYDYSTVNDTGWWLRCGASLTYDSTLLQALEDLGVFTDLGSSEEEVVKVTTIKIEESYFWPSSAEINETPTDLTITEVSNKNNTNLLQAPPTDYDDVDRDDMIFSDYNNADNLLIGTEVIPTLGMWGSIRVENAVGVWSSSPYPIPRDYYVDATKSVDGDGTSGDPFQLSQLETYLAGTGTYSVVSGDNVYIYAPVGSNELSDPLTVVTPDNAEVNFYAWHQNDEKYPALLSFPTSGDAALFNFEDLLGGSADNINFKFYDIVFSFKNTEAGPIKLFDNVTVSQMELYNCLVTGDINFNSGITRDGAVGESDQNTVRYYTSTIAVAAMDTITGRVHWDDVVIHVESTDPVTPEELYIDSAEINLAESVYTMPAQNKINIIWESEPADKIPYIAQVNGTANVFSPDNYLWYYLEFTNTGQGASRWRANYGMEGFTRQGVGYLSFKPAKRDLYTDFDKLGTGDGTTGNPWNRSQFLTYFGNAGYEAIDTTARRGDTLWCKGTCYVHDEGAFIPMYISTQNITVRGWDINVTHVILVDFSESTALQKDVVCVHDGNYIFELTVKDFFFFSDSGDLGGLCNAAAGPDETPSAAFYNSSFQVPTLYLNRTQVNDTETSLIGSTIKVTNIRTWPNNNVIIIDNTAIDGTWQELTF